MSIFPNYSNTITANQAIRMIRSKAPNVNLDTAKVLYTPQQEILQIDGLTESTFAELCTILHASGMYNPNSATQNFYNLGGYAQPLHDWKCKDCEPSVRKAVDDGCFVIMDIVANDIVNPKNMTHFPVHSAPSKNTHFQKLVDATAVMYALQESEWIMDRLQIVELKNGRFVS